MLEASNLNFGTFIMGDNRNRRRFVRAITLPQVIKWINAQNWDEYTKKQLIKRASKYPQNALEHFGQNIELQVVEIQKEKVEKERQKRENNERFIAQREEGKKEGQDQDHDSRDSSEGILNSESEESSN